MRIENLWDDSRGPYDYAVGFERVGATEGEAALSFFAEAGGGNR